MIAAALVEQIETLLEQGELSQRKIARRLGVSRGTVNAIALGKRTVRPRRQQAEDDFLPPDGPVARCPTCGGLVRMPCLACRVRATRNRRRLDQAMQGGKNAQEPSKPRSAVREKAPKRTAHAQGVF